MLCAIVTVARKLAGILRRMWIDGSDFKIGFGIGSGPPIQNDRNFRNKLVQEVEVADIPCQ
jgi:hypothetical protein